MGGAVGLLSWVIGSLRSAGLYSTTANLSPHPRVPPVMDTAFLTTKFDRIGARLKFAGPAPRRHRTTAAISLDVQSDRKGEFFEISLRPNTPPEIEPLDVRPADRHLLLLVREGRDKSKFLCGHDERHLFVAAIPEAAPVGTV